jgi:(1->4)-alpha-D-glucan 1-alpha-D-glucosylmutase
MGPESEFAGWFDIDWESDRRYLQGKLLVPFLGNQYGAVLESGALRLKFDAEAGALGVWAYDSHKLPICPLHYDRILGTNIRSWSAWETRSRTFPPGVRTSPVVPGA